MDKSIKIMRNELYELVWTTPITKLAKEYGLSDVGLSKLCKRHLIPTPERGYWAKKQHNRILPKKTKLLSLSTKNKQLEQIVITPKIVTEYSDGEVDEISAYEKRDENKVSVDYSTELTHPVVIRTAKSLNSAKPCENGALKPKAKNCLDIKVTRKSIDRAMHIMDAILNAFEHRGIKVCRKYYKYNDKQVLAFELNETQIEISLIETIQRRRHLKSAEEIAKIKRDPYYRYKLPQYDYTPTGKLTVKMENIWGYKGRKSWSDAKIQRLDNCLKDFLISFQKATIHLKELEEQRRLEEIRREALRQKRINFEKAKQEEQDRVDQLLSDTEAWHQSQRIRRYVSEIGNMRSKSQPWIEWALEQADRIDPTTNSPQSI